ncbi:Fur-regulated basic protein FbpA [Alkalihalobacillus sp. BA299]|uniref:Fur-regulated basic protein FbpA n=1 Tax=Alkalihalobacillus sp. BA299 TaxID=2815938 RepID=UPI001ADC2582|nr:Fur-regulated basic protein FbpA [Alkalihalobacillus sp. BA299]
MSFVTKNLVDKEQLIDSLIKNQHYKMPDGRQFYEASEQELKTLICSHVDNQYAFCEINT